MPRTAILLIPFLSLLATAQSVPSRWADVTAITAGTEIRVDTATSKAIQGKVASVTDSTLVITLKTGMQSFQQAEVTSVSVKKKGHRLRNTLIGLGIGTGAGLGIGVGATNGCSELLCGVAIAGITGAGAIGGTVTGLLWHTGGWRPVYAR